MEKWKNSSLKHDIAFVSRKFEERIKNINIV